MRMSAPLALESKKDPRPPGTRIMSPKVVMMTSGCSAMAMASSRRPMGRTHTGQPGPWTRVTFSGR